MLSAALALALSQAPVRDKAGTFHDAAAADCPSSGAVVANNPTIGRLDPRAGPRSGFPDMVHMPPVFVVNPVVRMINGCSAPLVIGVLFAGKPAARDGAETVPAKPAP